MKLTKEKLFPYLPYNVMIYYIGEGRPFRGTKKKEILTCKNMKLMLFSNQRKIALKPLSDLTKEIEVNGEKFVPHNRTQVGMTMPFYQNNIGIIENRIQTNTITYSDMIYLISLHFDVFGLIKEGLAIDINTLLNKDTYYESL